MTLGIDLGISATKFVIIDNGEVTFREIKQQPMSIELLEWYLDTVETLGRMRITEIAVTGVGSQKIGDRLYNRPVTHVDEFEANETPEARFAHAMDNLQPVLLNHSNGGRDWKEHGVSADKVYGRQSKTKLGSEKLYEYTEEIIKEHIRSGEIQENKQS